MDIFILFPEALSGVLCPASVSHIHTLCLFISFRRVIYLRRVLLMRFVLWQRKKEQHMFIEEETNTKVHEHAQSILTYVPMKCPQLKSKQVVSRLGLVLMLTLTGFIHGAYIFVLICRNLLSSPNVRPAHTQTHTSCSDMPRLFVLYFSFSQRPGPNSTEGGKNTTTKAIGY